MDLTATWPIACICCSTAAQAKMFCALIRTYMHSKVGENEHSHITNMCMCTCKYWLWETGAIVLYVYASFMECLCDGLEELVDHNSMVIGLSRDNAHT